MDISTREEWRRGIKNQAGREKLNGLGSGEGGGFSVQEGARGLTVSTLDRKETSLG